MHFGFTGVDENGKNVMQRVQFYGVFVISDMAEDGVEVWIKFLM